MKRIVIGPQRGFNYFYKYPAIPSRDINIINKNFVPSQNKPSHIFKGRAFLDIISKSHYLTILQRAGYSIKKLRFIDKGTYKYCYRLFLKGAVYEKTLAVLISSSILLDREYQFYKKYEGAPQFPRMHEKYCIKAPIIMSDGDIIENQNILIRDFVDLPPMAEFIGNESIMLKYLKEIRSLMLKGVTVMDDMDISNMNNAFYNKSNGTFKFIDYRGMGFFEYGVSRIIRYMARGEIKSYRDYLVKMFLDIPQFQKRCGETIREVEEYWEIIDSIAVF